MKTTRMIVCLGLATLVLACFPLSPAARADCREGCDLARSNTFLGDDALISNTTGVDNTAIGVAALQFNTIGSFNTATGGEALLSNTTGIFNTATGLRTLFNNTTGSNNTATGFGALFDNTVGYFNTATGVGALQSNTSGYENTADGLDALAANTTGSNNTATGWSALNGNTTGNDNTAIGVNALLNNTSGVNNIALGASAGSAPTIGDNNIDIGNTGFAAEGNTIRVGTEGTQTRTFIAGINGAAVMGGPVKVNADGQLGTTPSSQRFKDEIKPMGKASEAILALKPVTFRYKKEIDPDGTPQFGLVAEDVERINPDLVIRDRDGRPYTVRYEAVNAMLLNEFLKEHRKIEEQRATIAELKSVVLQQQKEFQATAAMQREQIQGLTTRLKEQDSKIEKVSDRPELSSPRRAAQIVLNN